MKLNKILIVLFITIILILCGIIYTTVDAVSKNGSSGDEVKKIQEKLSELGFYTGDIDGIFGNETEEAVKDFQKSEGLTIDGIVGNNTLESLGIKEETSESTTNNSNDLNLLARIIHGEARGEEYVGQVAIGAVVLNRVKNSNFPNTVAGVIYQSGAFDAVADGQINLEPDDSAKKAAQDALNGWDPTLGAIYYFNPATATNKWIWSRPETITIGRHRFAK